MKLKVHKISQEQLLLMAIASRHTKMPLTEKEILEAAIQAYYTTFKKEFPELFPKDYDPVHAHLWV